MNNPKKRIVVISGRQFKWRIKGIQGDLRVGKCYITFGFQLVNNQGFACTNLKPHMCILANFTYNTFHKNV